MPQIRISEAARLLGVSDDTARRWVESGRLRACRGEGGRLGVDGAELARLAQELADPPAPGPASGRSARNRFVGLVTGIRKDAVMAQVDIQAGPHRVVSLVSTEAVEELGLEVGSLAVAVIKATNVTIETP